MKRKHEVRSDQTLNTLDSLTHQGVDKIGLLIRHSDRFFHEDARMEPFMGLTPDGKEFARDFGTRLAQARPPRLFSSFFGRCIETAFLIDKGFTAAHGTALDHNCTKDPLAPFYIKDIEKAIHQVEKIGSVAFLREWFDKKIDESVMENPEATADRLCRYMADQLTQQPDGHISIHVSHDWNIFPIKEFKMDLPHETHGDVGYLDGLAFFEKHGKPHVISYQCGPVEVSP